jgi:hypothetical protein
VRTEVGQYFYMHRNTKIFLSQTFMDSNPVKERLLSDIQNLNNVSIWRAENQIAAGDLLSKK